MLILNDIFNLRECVGTCMGHGSGGAMVPQVSCFLPPVGPGNPVHVVRLGIEPSRQPAPRLEGFFVNVNF